MAEDNVRKSSDGDETGIESDGGDTRDSLEEEAPDNSIIVGTDEDDTLTGLEDNDVFLHSGGTDVIDGGNGFDLISYHESVTPIIMIPDGDPEVTLVYMAEPKKAEVRSLSLHGSHVRVKSRPEPLYTLKDTLKNMEAVVGGHGADWLMGNDNTNVLVGGPGSDVLFGRGGRDFFCVLGCLHPPLYTGKRRHDSRLHPV